MKISANRVERLSVGDGTDADGNTDVIMSIRANGKDHAFSMPAADAFSAASALRISAEIALARAPKED